MIFIQRRQIIRFLVTKPNIQRNPIERELYSPQRDPMKNLSEEEVKEIKQRIRREGEKMYSIGFAIIGGGFGALLLSFYIFGSPNKSH
jgi:hypothetical protein